MSDLHMDYYLSVSSLLLDCEICHCNVFESSLGNVLKWLRLALLQKLSDFIISVKYLLGYLILLIYIQSERL